MFHVSMKFRITSDAIPAFACGIIGFMSVTKAALPKTLALVLLPFIPGNTIKLILMVFITKKFRPVIFNYTH